MDTSLTYQIYSGNMNQDQIKLELTTLFEKTGKDHHQAYIDTDGADPEWPDWYAEKLHIELSKILNASFTKSELIYLLVLVEKEREIEAPGSDWLMYYANFFIERYI